MGKEKTIVTKPDKFEYIFEDDECTQIWKFNLKKFRNGPIEVITNWKPKYLKELELKRKRGR